MADASNKQLTSWELYPKMMDKGRVLVIDYNTLHYTSFDIFRILLLDKDFYKALIPEFRPFLRMKKFDQVDFMYRNQKHTDLYEMFSDIQHREYPYDMCELLERYHKFPAKHYTTTDLGQLLTVGLSSPMISKVGVLRFSGDQSKLNLPETCSTYKTENLFDPEAIANFVNSNHFNTVILDSIDLAVEIAKRTENVTFIFGSYAYNYDYGTLDNSPFRSLRRLDETIELEFDKKHEFGRFDPFRSLLTARNEEKQDGKDNDSK